ncbi:MAG: extracellular solute-binding protein, partial [Bacteroidales bacterium]|nr:extracellular solute-binding protein [Candidatus Equibacterium intestinale]
KVENYLNEVKPNLLGWEADFGKELMTQEKAWLNLTWSGDAKWAIDEAKEVGVELEYVVPDEGSNVWFDGWLIPKYAQNVKAARYFINFMCRSDNAIRNMEEIGYVSAVGTDEVLEYMMDFAQEEGAVDTLDASYFFGDAAKAVVLDHVFYADQSVIDRCALMHDSGDRTKALLEMWSRVKGNNMNLTTVIILAVAVIAIVAAVLAKAKKNARHKKSTKKSHK